MVQNLKGHWEELRSGGGGAGGGGGDLPHKAQLGNLDAALRNTGTATRELGQAIDSLAGPQIQGLGAAARGLEGALDAVAASSGLSAGLIVGIGLAALASVTGLLILGSQFDETSDRIQTGANVSKEAVEEMMTTFGSLIGQIPHTVTEMGDAYAAVAGRLEVYTGATLTAEQATQLVRTAAAGAAAGNQSLAASLNALTQIMMATGTPLEEQARLMDQIFNISRLTGTGYEAMATSLGRMSARLGEAAPEMGDLGVATVLAGEAGLTGARAMMMVTGMLTQLVRPTDDAKRELAFLGAEYKYNADGSMNLVGTLRELVGAFSGLTDTEQRHALAVKLVGEQYAPILEKILKAAARDLDGVKDKVNETGTAEKGLAAHTDDLADKMGLLGTRAHAAAGAIGQTLAGALVNVSTGFDEAGGHVREYVDLLNQLAGYPAFKPGSSGDHVQQDFIERIQKGWQFLSEYTGGTPAPAPASGGGGGATGGAPMVLDPAAIRANADAMQTLGSEGQRLHNLFIDMADSKTLGTTFDKLNEISATTSQLADRWRAAFDPERPGLAEARVSRLNALLTEYSNAVTAVDNDRRDAAASAIDALNRQVEAEDRAYSIAQRTEAFAKRQAEEQKRLAREAAAADVGTGLAEAWGRGLAGADLEENLAPAAAATYSAFLDALAKQGTEHASAAGKTLGDSINRIGEEARKQGVSGWQDYVAQAFDIADAIRRGEPEATGAMRDLLAGLSNELRAAEFSKAWGEESARNTLAATKEEAGYQRTLADEARRWAEAYDSAAQSHREALENLRQTRSEQDDLNSGADLYADNLRLIRQSWEDIDHSAQQARETARNMTSDSRSERDAGIAAGREQARMARDHQERLDEIRKKGGASAGEQTAAENESYQRSLRNFREQQNFAQQDRQRRVSDRAADLADTSKFHDEDLGKTRDRQEQETGWTRSNRDVQMDARDRLATMHAQQAEARARERADLTVIRSMAADWERHERSILDTNLAIEASLLRIAAAKGVSSEEALRALGYENLTEAYPRTPGGAAPTPGHLLTQRDEEMRTLEQQRRLVSQGGAGASAEGLTVGAGSGGAVGEITISALNINAPLIGLGTDLPGLLRWLGRGVAQGIAEHALPTGGR